MPARRSFEEQLAAIDELRKQSPESALEPLRKALGHKNNYVVAKAADLARDFELQQLLPELLAAFDRFFDDAVKSDPQCWAKNAISRALAAFEYQEPDVFLRGMRHIQLEPVWGGRSDTAGTLRGTCALALVQCRSVPENQLLMHLLALLRDADKSVRVEAVLAIEQIGSYSAVLLLRLRALIGSDEPEVLGACYSGILRIEGAKAIPWIARFLETADDAAGEAALAIAATHSPEAFSVLHKQLQHDHDPWFRSVLFSAIALTRQPEALDFLLDLVRKESRDASFAVEALLRSMPSPEIVQQIEQMVADKPDLARTFARHRADSK
jgi:HEAT repeat protein